MTALLAVAAVAMGQALQVANGFLHPAAIGFLSSALVCCALAVVLPWTRWGYRRRDLVIVCILAAGAILQFKALLTDAPGVYMRNAGPGTDVSAQFLRWIGAAAVVTGSFIIGGPRTRRLAVPLLLVTHAAAGVWMIQVSPDPSIDVYVFQRDSARELLAGRNPYAMTFPNIYGDSPFYGEGLAVNGRLLFGFPYPPLSLVFAVLGSMAGDVRYAHLAAMTAAGALMAYARPGRLAPLAAAVFLFTPRGFFVLEQSWTEPFVVLLLAATVFAACRRPALMPYLLGLFVVVKQYLIFVVPLAWLLLGGASGSWKDVRRVGLIAAATGAIVSLPLALWDVRAFVADVVLLQMHQPFRTDALSYLALAVSAGWPPLPASIAFGAAAAAAGVSLRRLPRTPAAFSAAIALTYLAFFAFNKQAFCNYYYFVIGALCCAIAATAHADEPAGDLPASR